MKGFFHFKQKCVFVLLNNRKNKSTHLTPCVTMTCIFKLSENLSFSSVLSWQVLNNAISGLLFFAALYSYHRVLQAFDEPLSGRAQRRHRVLTGGTGEHYFRARPEKHGRHHTPIKKIPLKAHTLKATHLNLGS